jgi:hypothetical protein
MAYLRSQQTPNVQIKYLKFDWSIYRLFVLNRSWKLVSLQIMIYVYICSTCCLVEVKTCFETWITKNDVNGAWLFNFSYLMTIMTYLNSQRSPNIQIKYFMFDGSVYKVFVLNKDWKLVSLQIMIFIYVCSTCGIVEIKTLF